MLQGIRANIDDSVMLGVDHPRENALLGSYLFCGLGSSTLNYVESQNKKDASNGLSMIQVIYKYRFGSKPGRAAALLKEVTEPEKCPNAAALSTVFIEWERKVRQLAAMGGNLSEGSKRPAIQKIISGVRESEASLKTMDVGQSKVLKLQKLKVLKRRRY